ncbi:hypothetical protein Hdeb2414_s0016g00476261 [Helianthus debilis subsp. tardiflorus]
MSSNILHFSLICESCMEFVIGATNRCLSLVSFTSKGRSYGCRRQCDRLQRILQSPLLLNFNDKN